MKEEFGKNLAQRVAEVAPRCAVPGVSIAVFRDGELHTATAGVLNSETGVLVTTDSLFYVGSVTKACVGTAIMILAEQGKINLEAAITRYLPGMNLAGEPCPPSLTVRQLLSHTSGIDGDFFIDTGPDDDCLAKYVERCIEVPLICEPGEAYSYCNAGYSILARIAERATGQVWDALLRQTLFEPLGMTNAFTLPADVARLVVSAGHMEAGGQTKPLPDHALPRCLGPAGFSLMTTPTDLVTLGRLLLDKGRATSGKRVLSELSVAAMTSPAIELPDGTHWGLGWKLQNWGGELVISHDGGMMGQAANLWIVPKHRLVYAQCANGGRSVEMHREVMFSLFAEYGLHEPATPEPDPNWKFDPTPYEGRFENIGITIDLARTEGGLNLHGVQKQFPSPVDLLLRPIDKERFVTQLGGSQPIIMSFSKFDARGVPQLFYAGRLHKRTG